MSKKLEKLLSNPKYIRKLIRRQNSLRLKVGVIAVTFIAYAINTEERLAAQEFKIGRISRELEELKRKKGV